MWAKQQPQPLLPVLLQSSPAFIDHLYVKILLGTKAVSSLSPPSCKACKILQLPFIDEKTGSDSFTVWPQDI